MFMNEVQRRALPHHMKTQYEGDIYKPESLLPISRSVRSKFLGFIKDPFMAFAIETQRDQNKFSIGWWGACEKA